MADITSSCTAHWAGPVGGMVQGCISTPATADDGDTIDLATLIGGNVKEVVFAVQNTAPGTTAGTAGNSHMAYGGTAVITIGGSDDNNRRDIFFVALSQDASV